MQDVLAKLKEIQENYDNEDIQRAINAAEKIAVAEEETVEEANNEVVDEAEQAVEEDSVEEVHEEEVVEESVDNSDLERMIKLAGRSGVLGMNTNVIIAESVEVAEDEVSEGFGPPSNGAKNIQELISKMGADTPGDIIADIMHWADANDMEFSDLVRQGTMYYNDEKMMYNDDGDDEVTEAEERDYICVHAKKGKYECSGTSSYAAAKKAAEHWGLKSTAGIDAHLADKEHTATESIVEGRLGFRDLEMFGSEIASRIDQEARRRGSADMEPGDADQLRYMIAREMGLVESQVVENAERIIKVSNIDYAGPALDKLPTETTLKLNIPYDADEDDVYDMVADELEDRHGVKVSGFDMNFAESVEEDEDIIGNIIGKLAQTKAGQRGGKDVIGDIIAKLPKDADEPKTVNMPSLPKSKPERTPTVSAVAQQAAANKAVRSMAQDTTRPLRQSKFSEWSKK